MLMHILQGREVENLTDDSEVLLLRWVLSSIVDARSLLAEIMVA